MMQPMLVDLYDILNMEYQEELAELQNDESVKTLFNIKEAMASLCEETYQIQQNVQENYYYRFHIHI